MLGLSTAFSELLPLLPAGPINFLPERRAPAHQEIPQDWEVQFISWIGSVTNNSWGPVAKEFTEDQWVVKLVTQKLQVLTQFLWNILKALGIRSVGGTTRWSVVWKALGLAEAQVPGRAEELRQPLLDARATAELLGVDPSTLYRWSKGQVPIGMPPFPKVLDLSNGRANARSQRWRRAEVQAWHCHQDLPVYVRRSPVFGTLTPTA